MNFKDRFEENDDIWMYSNPLKAQKKAFEIYGNKAIIYRSKTKNKKYYIINPQGKKVNFGSMDYEDFTYHQDPSRQYNYLKRSNGIKGNWKSDGYSPNNLSRNILW